jgi:trk system potassium uptake protein
LARRWVSLALVRIFVVGAGRVGATIVEALHDEHEIVVFDLDPDRLGPLSYRYDVTTVVGNGASRDTLQAAGIERADLLIACTTRDEVNVVAAMFANKLSPRTHTVVRTASVEYVDAWREHQLDVDFVVCSGVETAMAVSRIIGVPAARQTDVFAEGQVQIVEFEIDERASSDLVGRPLREAKLPPDSQVAGIIRGGEIRLPSGIESIQPGDRIIVIGSPEAARAWSSLIAGSPQRVDDVVVLGGDPIATSIARVLAEEGIGVRVVDPDPARARALADELPRARVFNAQPTDSDFLERERILHAEAAVFALGDDATNHYAATLAKVHGLRFAIAIVYEAESGDIFERAGIDVTIDPRSVTAEEIIRFARDPRTRQLAMLEDDRFEVLDITVRPESELTGKRFRELPMTGAMIGAIVRNGTTIFPHGDDVLLPGDRVIIFTETSRVKDVERAL